MKITNTAHASYRVSDIDKALHFYRDILGLKQKFTIRFSDQVAYTDATQKDNPMMQAYVESMRSQGDKTWLTYLEVAPHQYIELFTAENTTKRCTFDLGHFDHIGYLHLALEVDDIQAAFKELKERGDVTIVTPPSFGVEQTWQLWIMDPDGNAIELMQYTDKSWQLVGNPVGE